MSLIIKFSQNVFKNKSMMKRNFIMYHFLVESKPHERIDLLITASMNIYQIKKSNEIVMKAFLKEKWWNNLEAPVSKRTPLFQPIPYLWVIFYDPQQETPPPPLILGRKKLCQHIFQNNLHHICSCSLDIESSSNFLLIVLFHDERYTLLNTFQGVLFKNNTDDARINKVFFNTHSLLW